MFLNLLNLIFDFKDTSSYEVLSNLQDNQLYMIGCVVGLTLIIVTVYPMPMPGVRCPNCAR